MEKSLKLDPWTVQYTGIRNISTAGGNPMGLEVKRALFLHRSKSITEDRLFNMLVDIAAGGEVDSVLQRIPTGYLCRFREWLDHLAPIETLIDPRTGSGVSVQEKATIEAIRAWLREHEKERVSETNATVSARPDKKKPRVNLEAPGEKGKSWPSKAALGPAALGPATLRRFPRCQLRRVAEAVYGPSCPFRHHGPRVPLFVTFVLFCSRFVFRLERSRAPEVPGAFPRSSRYCLRRSKAVYSAFSRLLIVDSPSRRQVCDRTTLKARATSAPCP